MRLEPSWRQPLGVFLILAWIAAWAVAAVTLAPLVFGLPRWLQFVYYAFAGLAWIAPLKPLLRWMETGRWRR